MHYIRLSDASVHFVHHHHLSCLELLPSALLVIDILHFSSASYAYR
ncbi:hypothetical protein OYT1_ch2440 [Ferriphaselus amnicola]|uniref:Uncharacterized protein n=1 Tax=Ferriphaselus amnicola TaxID=1188319 RepID=A0A2Z6GEA7_9PROT|nr:hypothetical protein OYT1_ch2440 [Ferriphaselus amnicola]